MARINLARNRKFHRLSQVLGNKALARGVLELLWEPCYEAASAYCGTSDDIEAICDWHGERGALTKALLSAGAPIGAGFIEPYTGNVRDAKEPHYQVHAFFEHAPAYVAIVRTKKRESGIEKVCAWCGELFHSSETRSKFCSPVCRQANYRAQADEDPDVTHRALRHGDAAQLDVRVVSATQCNALPSLAKPSLAKPSLRTDANVRTEEKSSSAPLTRAEPVATPPGAPTGQEEATAVTHVVVPDDPLVLTFPTIGPDGDEWYLNRSQVEDWSETYPGVAVVEECRKALSWIRADLTHRRKTKRGMAKFLNAWLSRSTERARGPTPLVTGSLKTAGNHEALQRFVNRGVTK